MPKIVPSSSIRSKYNELSELEELMKGLRDVAEGKVRDLDDLFQDMENE